MEGKEPVDGVKNLFHINRGVKMWELMLKTLWKVGKMDV